VIKKCLGKDGARRGWGHTGVITQVFITHASQACSISIYTYLRQAWELESMRKAGITDEPRSCCFMCAASQDVAVAVELGMAAAVLFYVRDVTQTVRA
jgi:hypothetical protein